MAQFDGRPRLPNCDLVFLLQLEKKGTLTASLYLCSVKLFRGEQKASKSRTYIISTADSARKKRQEWLECMITSKTSDYSNLLHPYQDPQRSSRPSSVCECL